MSPLLPSLVGDLLQPEKPQPAGPPPPPADLPQPYSRLPPHCEVDEQETYSLESPSSDEGDGMNMMSSRLETPTTLNIKFQFKKKKEDASGGDPNKEPSSQLGFPFGVDGEGVSVVSVSNEDGSDKGHADMSTDKSVLPPSQKRHLEDQASEFS